MASFGTTRDVVLAVTTMETIVPSVTAVSVISVKRATLFRGTIVTSASRSLTNVKFAQNGLRNATAVKNDTTFKIDTVRTGVTRLSTA